jgi:hypothetical protein
MSESIIPVAEAILAIIDDMDDDQRADFEEWLCEEPDDDE